MYRAIIYYYRRFFSFLLVFFLHGVLARPVWPKIVSRDEEMVATIDSFLVFEDTDLYCITYCTTFSLATAVVLYVRAADAWSRTTVVLMMMMMMMEPSSTAARDKSNVMMMDEVP